MRNRYSRYAGGGSIGFVSSSDADYYARKIKNHFFGLTNPLEVPLILTETEILYYLTDYGYDGKDRGRFLDMVISSLVDSGVEISIEEMANGGSTDQLSQLLSMTGAGMGNQKKSDTELKLEYKEKERLRKEKEKRKKERKKKFKKFTGSVSKGTKRIFQKIKKNWDTGGNVYSESEYIMDNMVNGQVSVEFLTEHLGREPKYPFEILNGLKLKKVFLKPYYSL